MNYHANDTQRNASYWKDGAPLVNCASKLIKIEPSIWRHKLCRYMPFTNTRVRSECTLLCITNIQYNITYRLPTLIDHLIIIKF